jgi:hypothetical protein
MASCNISFFAKFGEEVSQVKTTGEYKKQGDMLRITFNLKGENLGYSFTVSKNKRVTISCLGDFNYTFSLQEKENYRFMLNALSKPINCEVYCEKLSILNKNDKILINATYSMNIGGEISKNSFKLEAIYED